MMPPLPEFLVVHDVVVEWDYEAVLGQRPRLHLGAVPCRAVGNAARHHVKHPHRLQDESLSEDRLI